MLSAGGVYLSTSPLSDRKVTLKTLEEQDAVRCDPDHLHSNLNTYSYFKEYKTWKHVVGKSPNCATFQSHKSFIKFEIEEEGILNYKYVPLGCGHSLVCSECGKISLYRKLSRTISLTTALGVRFPKAEIASIVFTVPHNHSIHKNPSHIHFKLLFKYVKTVISKIFPGCPLLSVLHTWSSKNPNEKHIHIHCLIFGIKANGSLQHLFYPANQINSLWQNQLEYPFDTNIHIKYWLISTKPKTSHALRYTLRSPIVDFVKKIDSTLTSEYLSNIDPLINFQRIRWYGWMSNVHLKNTLNSFGIFLVPRVHSTSYKFISVVHVYLSEKRGGFITTDYQYIAPENIVNATVTIKKFFYEVRDPPI